MNPRPLSTEKSVYIGCPHKQRHIVPPIERWLHNLITNSYHNISISRCYTSKILNINPSATQVHQFTQHIKMLEQYNEIWMHRNTSGEHLEQHWTKQDIIFK